MSISLHRTVCFLSLLALSACQSDESKLSMLRGDRAIACLNADAAQREHELAKAPKSPPSNVDSLGRAYMDWTTKCELATRDLNRFMR